ncbi:MAG TPA: hypothetical protein VGJ91_03010 [Polyangiaceae bacterium]
MAVALSARAAAAAEAEVSVSCQELSTEDAAQVEARVRANLLSAGLSPAAVELSCPIAAAQTQVTGNGHQVTRRTERAASSLKEALLASADNALSAWSAETAVVAPSAAPAATAIPAAEPVPALESAPHPPPVAAPSRLPDARPAAKSRSASTWLSAGPRVEPWSSGSGLGGQIGVQQKLSAAFLAIHAGYLLSLPASSRFSAHDLQLGAQMGWQPPALFGLRAALGVGLSQFGASPAPGVSAQNSTSSTLPCLSVELSRPIEFGSLALLPAAGGRVFKRSRSVVIDGEPVLALPALALEVSLSLALKVGG